MQDAKSHVDACTGSGTVWPKEAGLLNRDLYHYPCTVRFGLRLDLHYDSPWRVERKGHRPQRKHGCNPNTIQTNISQEFRQ